MAKKGFWDYALTSGISTGIGKKKSNTSGQQPYNFTPYSGPTPPGIDTPENQYLRPTQDELQKIVMSRANGVGVGYDPTMKTQAIGLLKSQLDQSQEDQVRAAQGMAAGSGLGGNLAAQGALEGKVRRDIGRTYGQGVAQINIEDLARQNQERDINTGRLQQLNASNFGQENTRANFGLQQYNQEQGLQLAGDQFNTQTALANRDYNNQQAGEIGQFATNAGITALGAYTGNPMLTAAGVGGLTGAKGYGIAPTTTQPNQPSDMNSSVQRALMKRKSYYQPLNSSSLRI